MGMISYLEDDEVEELIDEVADNKSAFIKKAVREKLCDPSLYDDRIADREQEKRELMAEKQRIERAIEEKRDEIIDLKDRRSEMRTLQRVQRQVGMQRIEQIAKNARQHKYDSDPRSMTVEEIVENNAERIAKEEDVEPEKVRQVLKLHINV